MLLLAVACALPGSSASRKLLTLERTMGWLSLTRSVSLKPKNIKLDSSLKEGKHEPGNSNILHTVDESRASSKMVANYGHGSRSQAFSSLDCPSGSSATTFQRHKRDPIEVDDALDPTMGDATLWTSQYTEAEFWTLHQSSIN